MHLHGVAGGAVDDGAVGDVFAVVDEDGPDLHEDEEAQVRQLLEREDEGEEVVGDALEEAVDRVEGDGCVRRGHDPLVVRLVQRLVHHRVVQATVDEVHQAVGEEDEQRELEDVVPHARAVLERVVEFGVAVELQPEAGRRQQRHAGHAAHRLPDLHGDLVVEELGVLEGGFVEDEDIRERRHDEVDGGTAKPAAR